MNVRAGFLSYHLFQGDGLVYCTAQCFTKLDWLTADRLTG